MFGIPPDRTAHPLVDLILPFLALPELRGFWPFSSVNESGNALDLSGQGRTLTNNSATPRGVYNNFVAYADPDGTADYFSRADEAGLDITGALFFGGWFWFDDITGTPIFIGKSGAGSNVPYRIQLSAGVPTFIIGDGASTDSIGAGAAIVASRWYHIAGRYTPSSEINLFLNGLGTSNAASIPASLLNTADAFSIGARASVPDSFMNGRAALCFLCADDPASALVDSLFQQTRSAFGV